MQLLSKTVTSIDVAVAEQGHAMEVDFRDIPELQQFVVANVEPTGKKLGVGAYGSVEEVKIPGAIVLQRKFTISYRIQVVKMT